MAKGYTYTLGIDYQETFAPISKMNSIKILLSLTVNLDWTLHQFDVRNAFLQGNLEEEIYLDVPPGFKNLFNKRRVCKPKKSLYGLKQSPIAWFERFTKSFRRYGFTQSQRDHTLFFK